MSGNRHQTSRIQEAASMHTYHETAQLPSYAPTVCTQPPVSVSLLFSKVASETPGMTLMSLLCDWRWDLGAHIADEIQCRMARQTCHVNLNLLAMPLTQ